MRTNHGILGLARAEGVVFLLEDLGSLKLDWS